MKKDSGTAQGLLGLPLPLKSEATTNYNDYNDNDYYYKYINYYNTTHTPLQSTKVQEAAQEHLLTLNSHKLRKLQKLQLQHYYTNYTTTQPHTHLQSREVQEAAQTGSSNIN